MVHLSAAAAAIIINKKKTARFFDLLDTNNI
jgi:hypothetical protein